ncbi:hypothetical protein QIS99_18470 [Streptomyces sp. B-S-A8]|uniref:Integral membrane protein n=1 Tax=Streptomyces solicavernae TaxID=3043614 RepID=A0ABT6RUQ7_9ACTN|nr:hypothetical protein [Streptomyces sp. B-S-A8]MDI3388172.1 hypothetical protein [Streptomyces sp. B-S-A8]
MAIESDQLVFDYLSRVGDLAQQRQLPSKTRMRLVAELRAEIDRRRATVSGGKTPGDSPAGVRRILDRLGTPEEVVGREAGSSRDPDDHGAPADVPAKRADEAEVREKRADEAEVREKRAAEAEAWEKRAAEAGPAVPESAVEADRGSAPKSRLRPSLFVPEQRTDEQRGREPRFRNPLRPRLTKDRLTKDPAPPAEPPPTVSTPPHLAGEDEMGPSGSTPDWWRIENGPHGFTDSVPGFVGGVEIPEILRPPRPEDASDAFDDSDKSDGPSGEGEGERQKRSEGEAAGDEGEESGGGRRLPFLRRARAARGAPALSNPLLLLAAASLVAGAVLGNWIALGAGWAVAYTSRRLTQREAKFAALGIPGAAAAAGVVWLWGRFDRRWGEEVPAGATVDALGETWPWVVRLAAVASALFLVWRSQRQRPE